MFPKLNDCNSDDESEELAFIYKPVPIDPLTKSFPVMPKEPLGPKTLCACNVHIGVEVPIPTKLPYPDPLKNPWVLIIKLSPVKDIDASNRGPMRDGESEKNSTLGIWYNVGARLITT